MTGLALASSAIRKVIIDETLIEGNQSFRVSGHCLVDSSGTSLIRCLGDEKEGTSSKAVDASLAALLACP
jgi:hypothetical protein